MNYLKLSLLFILFVTSQAQANNRDVIIDSYCSYSTDSPSLKPLSKDVLADTITADLMRIVCKGTKPINSEKFMMIAICPTNWGYVGGGYSITNSIEDIGAPSPTSAYPYFGKDDNAWRYWTVIKDPAFKTHHVQMEVSIYCLMRETTH